MKIIYNDRLKRIEYWMTMDDVHELWPNLPGNDLYDVFVNTDGSWCMRYSDYPDSHHLE